MKNTKTFALVAHDNKKKDLIDWFEGNCEILLIHQLVCTGTTGRMLEDVIEKKLDNEKDAIEVKPIIKLKSGPLGGDQQLGAMISEGKIDVLIFFWDPMEPHPHDVDVKALLRISALYNIPVACNRSSADFIISSPLISDEYKPLITDHQKYIDRQV